MVDRSYSWRRALTRAGSFALLGDLGRSVDTAFAGIIIVSRSGSGSGGHARKLLGKTAPHSLRIAGVFVASVLGSLVPVDLQDITVRDGV